MSGAILRELRESPQPVEEEPERPESPDLMHRALRRVYGGRGGEGCPVDREQENFEQAEHMMEMMNRIFEEDVTISPLPDDRTGGLRFRRGVPEALLHLSRNNLSALQRLSDRVEQEKRRAVGAAGRFDEPGGRVALASLLYCHAPDIPMWLIGESLGLEASRVRTLGEENPTAIVRCLDCDEPIRPQGRYHFQEMLRYVEEFNKNPALLREFLYTGLHCEECVLEREDRWGKEWVRQELEYRRWLLNLRAMPYEEYLQTPHWKRRREDRLRAAGRRCQLCNRGSGTLNVHHRTYERLGEELDGDLIVLCRSCHSTFHEHHRLER